MSREIKFRAWDHDNNKMIYWTLNDLLVRFGDPKYQFNVEDRPSPLFNWFEYTGFKDENGEEIIKNMPVKRLEKNDDLPDQIILNTALCPECNNVIRRKI